MKLRKIGKRNKPDGECKFCGRKIENRYVCSQCEIKKLDDEEIKKIINL